jgi:hypothetical protein
MHHSVMLTLLHNLLVTLRSALQTRAEPGMGTS